MVKLLDIPETITYSLSNVKLILVTNNYFVEINKVIKGLTRKWLAIVISPTPHVLMHGKN